MCLTNLGTSMSHIEQTGLFMPSQIFTHVQLEEIYCLEGGTRRGGVR